MNVPNHRAVRKLADNCASVEHNHPGVSPRLAKNLAEFHADIHEAPNRDGNFVAALRGAEITTAGRDPEHDLCHAMVAAGLPDGGIQFWRGSTPSLFYRSVHQAARLRIEIGETFPYRLVRRREGWPETHSKPGAGVMETGGKDLAAHLGQPARVGLPGADFSGADREAFP